MVTIGAQRQDLPSPLPLLLALAGLSGPAGPTLIQSSRKDGLRHCPKPIVPPHPKDFTQPVRTGEMSRTLGTVDKSEAALTWLARMRSSVILNRGNETGQNPRQLNTQTQDCQGWSGPQRAAALCPPIIDEKLGLREMIRAGQTVAGQLAAKSLGERRQSCTFTQYNDLQSPITCITWRTLITMQWGGYSSHFTGKAPAVTCL